MQRRWEVHDFYEGADLLAFLIYWLSKNVLLSPPRNCFYLINYFCCELYISVDMSLVPDQTFVGWISSPTSASFCDISVFFWNGIWDVFWSTTPAKVLLHWFANLLPWLCAGSWSSTRRIRFSANPCPTVWGVLCCWGTCAFNGD